jgi:Ring finger domain
MLFSKNNNVAAPTINGRNKYESVEHYFLAIAKDVRYVQQCTDLLGHILGPSSARTSRILAEYMSWILYILLTTKSAILRREGQTLQTATTTPGMEVCQLKYVQESVPLEKTALWSRLSSVLLRNTSLTTVALFSVTLLYGIRFQSERIMQRKLSALSLSPDQYQGQARRDVYLLQRKEMIRRGRDIVSGIAEAPSNTTDATNLKKPDGKSNVDENVPNQGSYQAPLWDRMLPRLYAVLRSVVVALDRALLSNVEGGPHDPVAATTMPEAASTVATTTLEDRLRQVFLWIFQFHLACYCISGKYPTILHRFVKQTVVMTRVDDHRPQPTQPSSSVMPMVGAMMLCRLSYQFLFHAISQPLIRYCATQRHSSFLRRRRKGTFQNTITMTATPAQTGVALVGQSPRTERASHMACYICQQPPLYPSCLIPCGHVFCWYCIQQWITDHDAKCPICRVQCAAKDVMYLYNV